MKKTALSSLSFTLLLLLCVILSSCGVSSDVVSNKKIQKRKYQKGLFLAKKSNTVQKNSNPTEYSYVESNYLKNTKKKDSSPHLDGITKSENTSDRTENRIRKETNKKNIQQIRELNELAHTKLNNAKSTKEKLSNIGIAKNITTNYEASLITATAVKKYDVSNLLSLGLKLLILGLILFVLGLLLGIGIGPLASIFFLLSSLAWIGGLVCVILHYIEVYDL